MQIHYRIARSVTHWSLSFSWKPVRIFLKMRIRLTAFIEKSIEFYGILAQRPMNMVFYDARFEIKTVISSLVALWHFRITLQQPYKLSLVLRRPAIMRRRRSDGPRISRPEHRTE